MAGSLASRLAALQASVAKCKLKWEDVPNVERRVLFSKVGLLELDVLESSGRSAPGADEKAALLEQVSTLAESLQLRFIENKRGMFWRLVNLLDDSVRILTTWVFMLDFCVFVTPWTLLLDRIYPAGQMCLWGRQMLGKMCLQLSGVELTVEGASDALFPDGVNMLAFTHASTMDAFVLGAVPCQTFTLSKKELFIIPFFGWLLAAFGGVAIDRGDRQQASDALLAAVESGRSTAATAQRGSAVSISPEGTRSKTGQLLPFKKGPFYAWQDLDSAVVPFLIFGAYDLYGPGKYMSTAGKVVARFLPPIQPSEVDPQAEPAERRERMSRLLRRRMLEAGLHGPSGVGDEGGIGYSGRLGNFSAIAACWSFNVFLGHITKAVLHDYDIATSTAALGAVGATIGTSIGVYLYSVYMYKPKRKSSEAKAKAKATKAD